MDKIKSVLKILILDEMVSEIMNKIITDMESNIMCHIKDDDIPSDFLDPLTCTLIKAPIMIPNVNEVFDKSTILNQI
jgi:hypothetical protein